MVNSAIGEHFEILSVALRGCVSIRLVEGVGHAQALNGLLRNAVDRGRRLNPCGFKDCRHNIDDVMKLRANAANIVDVAGPRNGHPLPCAAEVRCNLLGPFERRIKCPRPCH